MSDEKLKVLIESATEVVKAALSATAPLSKPALMLAEAAAAFLTSQYKGATLS